MEGSEAASKGLQHALVTSATRAGFELTISASDWERWSSNTFDGAQHVLSIEAPDSSAFGHWLANLGDMKLQMRGHKLMNITAIAKRASSGRAKANLQALTVRNA